MARMTLDELTSAVQVNVPEAEEAQVKQAANFFLRRLARKDLSFTRVRTTITTLAPVDTTVTVSLGSSSVTCTDAAATWVGQVVLFDGSDQWFTVATVDAGVGFTITSLFDGTSLTGGGATVAFPRIALDADLIQVEQLKHPGDSSLSSLSSEVKSVINEDAETGTPYGYFLAEPVNTSDALEVFLIDYPDDVYTYTLIGRNRLTRFTSTGNKCGLPERYEDVLIAGTLYFVLTGFDPKGDLTFLWRTEMLEGINDIKKSAIGGATDRGEFAGADGAGTSLLVSKYPSGAS